MTLHTFGDSHSEWAFNQIPGVVCHPLYSKLCYSFGKNKLSLLDISDPIYKVATGDTVLFLFGEIDCSCHVWRQSILQNKSDTAIIDELVKNYMDTILENIRLVGNIKVIIASLPPPAKSSEVFYEPNSEGKQWLRHRFLGTDEDRKRYFEYFNLVTKKKCEMFGYKFLDIYTPYQTQEGYLDRKYSDNSVHIKNPIFIRERIQDFL
jgi:hypothetical protein